MKASHYNGLFRPVNRILLKKIFCPLSLLHNDFRIQPLGSMAVWGRRVNSLFPKHLVFTFFYVIVFLPKIRQNCTSKLFKTAFLLNPAGLTASPQLQKIMRSAYQRPLAAASLKSSPHKLVKAANILNLSKHWLDRFTSNLIQFSATLGQKFSFHQLCRR